jgi:hypothetical protein
MSNDLWFHLPDLERSWRLTGNPLYVWRAIGRTRNVDPPEPVPDWCLSYLAEVGRNIARLSLRDDPRAVQRAVEILGFSRKGKKNAFAAIVEDRNAKQAALDADNRAFGYPGIPDPLAKIMKERGITASGAEKILRRGRLLDGAPKQKSVKPTRQVSTR